jgi:hypothetical protein
MWSTPLHYNVQSIFADQTEDRLHSPARCAEDISEVATQTALASVCPPPERTALLKGIEDLSVQVAVFSAEQDRLRTSYRDPRLN